MPLTFSALEAPLGLEQASKADAKRRPQAAQQQPTSPPAKHRPEGRYTLAPASNSQKERGNVYMITAATGNRGSSRQRSSP